MKFTEHALKTENDKVMQNLDVYDHALDIMMQMNNTEIVTKGFNDVREGFRALLSKDPEKIKAYMVSKDVDVSGKAVQHLETQDSVMPSNNSPMFTAASSVIPINDGSVQLAKSDPKDSAIFAKTGGPFDTLFNGIFAKINEVSEILPKSMSYNMPIDIRKSLSESLSHSKDTTNNPNIQINPIKIELNGKLELTNSNGQSVDIINTIKNNPMLLRQLSELISQSINENIYGGKSTFNAGVTTSRFKPL